MPLDNSSSITAPASPKAPTVGVLLPERRIAGTPDRSILGHMLTPLTYTSDRRNAARTIHVGDAGIDYSGHKMFVHDLIRVSLFNFLNCGYDEGSNKSGIAKTGFSNSSISQSALSMNRKFTRSGSFSSSEENEPVE